MIRHRLAAGAFAVLALGTTAAAPRDADELMRRTWRDYHFAWVENGQPLEAHSAGGWVHSERQKLESLENQCRAKVLGIMRKNGVPSLADKKLAADLEREVARAFITCTVVATQADPSMKKLAIVATDPGGIQVEPFRAGAPNGAASSK